MDFGNRLVKEFTNQKSKRNQRFIRMPLKGEKMVADKQKSIAHQDRVKSRFYTLG
jgi:hypothetical protein